MNISALFQPEKQLGSEIDRLLSEDVVYPRIVFVSAFVALRTILRLRERLLAQMEAGAYLRFTIGIDLGGTSREVLEELLRWNCETFVFHNAIPRATFHPKIYLFESATTATLFVGSNNFTDGGFYTNYEAATRCDFELPADADEYKRLLEPLTPLIEPQGVIVRRLDLCLIQTLVDRGELPSEAEARQRQRDQAQARRRGSASVPANPFAPVPVPLPPLLSKVLRKEEPEPEERQPPAQTEEAQPKPAQPDEQPQQPVSPRPAGVLVWRKTLPPSDALQVNPGTHHVGGVRLTQAQFENPPGQRIDQTTYFRQIFADYQWERESGGRRDQEHTFVPIRIVIRGHDYGVRNFEISHKPSGEAGQANYTTILRWGREFNPTILTENLTGTVLSLYETAEPDADFLIEITDAD